MEFSIKVGWLGVFGAIIGYGLFGLPMKHKKVLKANMNSVIYSFYLSFMVFLVPFFLLFVEPIKISIYGVISGIIWIPACFASIVVVQSIGLTVGISVWSVLVMFISFCWGQIFGHKMKNATLTIIGLILIFGGILSLIKIPRNESGADGEETTKTKPTKAIKEEEMNFGKTNIDDQELSSFEPWSSSVDNLMSNSGSEQSGEDLKKGKPQDKEDKKVSNFVGWLGILIIGICGGSTYAPLELAKAEDNGLMIPFSFGIGAFSSITFVTILYCIKKKMEGKNVKELFHFKICYFALLSGLIWCLGNICSIIAILSPLGLAVGYPLTQLAVLLSSISGIILFKEITGKNIFYFSICFVIAISGGILLGIYG
ncbi:transmembrane protein [Anaeramoeba flamelloides]|uniref:Transmembrane protein n=1 Tax=Anaeramoeba flamelloides TaxID=1746091 RepID=A0ABQ8YE77_9EUKA|nr:transmembrane protein [Anaeramoeba flamelloides]